MLNKGPFYFSITRKMTAVFGTLFNDMKIIRDDTEGATKQVIHIPFSYAPKEKVLARLEGDPGIDRKTAVTLPRMSFELQTIMYDPSRQLNSIVKNSVKNTATGNYNYQFMSVPYNFHFTLWVYAKSIEDGNKIIEQILPFFSPEHTVRVNLIPEMNIEVNVPIILNSVNLEDSYDGQFADRRAIVWTLDFTLKGNYYGPISEDKVIKFANVSFYIPPGDDLRTAVGNTAAIDRVTSQPGLTANGEPTSNIALTIPYQEINEDDDYGYINIIYGYLDPPENDGGH